MTEAIAPGLLPEGLADRLPPKAEASARLVREVLDTVASHGYRRVMPALAEFEETLVARLQSARAEDLLRAVDPLSQRSLAIRPDMTAQIGRIAATRMAATPRPLRLCYGGPVMKLRADQLRPERERMQVGAEIIGTDSVAAAVEIVNVAIEALQRAGVSGITIDFTLPDLVTMLADGPMPLPQGDVEAVRDSLDAKDAGSLAALGEAARPYLALIEATGPFHPAMDRLQAFNAGPAKGRLDNLIAALRAIAKPIGWDITLTLDPTERHGFEYQSWFGFSVFAEGFIGEIGRGGSYAVAGADGKAEPAMGFSLYPDPLIDAGFGTTAAQRAFLPIGHDGARAAALRAEGWVTIAALDEADDPLALGCEAILDGTELRRL
ncbi:MULTISPECIES: ATP phosphoribosyltransferase regulatory subunit [unclassified Sphingobium]|uniref:ATP phosphoribosyltransferase regulatory subunit n=1 Tax=unclassified Sphingobium TaxID=2611147 RepID=UPI00222503FE|nr:MULTISPECIES: ATP phosphoribosyltransferase regulatory subunit [unclassified Sphingobium]MCW2348838.1 ATP phosphoribosyltransferase regulatory subunit [Sphingobium sp. B12D2B]MCW2367966.1 ATP phosphoribosyltransferase regulatory subunit [Sphingobium sp. B11D3D]MCW2383283.1 ATP phosphoribosyltransferase regulatory subunit [Sphingobium sp. B2D3B]MCW2392361.1 ATP phosphoribosyltransferase regulatory subunit [Sphingobium sp. B11D3A]MCW2399742.1 ATP phosphoribosyltransferase regulatory subunit [